MRFVYFRPEDVVRHRLVREIIRAFDVYHERDNGSSEDGVGEVMDPEAEPDVPTKPERPSVEASGDVPERGPTL